MKNINFKYLRLVFNKLKSQAFKRLNFLTNSCRIHTVLLMSFLLWSPSVIAAGTCFPVKLKAVKPAPSDVSNQVHKLKVQPAPVGTSNTSLYGGNEASVTLLLDGTFTGKGSDTSSAAFSSQGRIGSPGSVKGLTKLANDLHYDSAHTGTRSAYVDTHLASGEAAFGNTISNDANFATGTHKANAGHNGMETTLKSIKEAAASRFHNNGRDQTHFIAVDSTNPNVAYKPVVQYKVNTSSESVFEFEQANPTRPLLSIPSTATVAKHDLVTKGMPAYYDLQIKFYMDEWAKVGGNWKRTGNIKVMPAEVAKHLLPTSSAGVTKLKINRDQPKVIRHPLRYEYIPGNGPRLTRRVWNWGPENDSIQFLYPGTNVKAVEPPWAANHLNNNPVPW